MGTRSRANTPWVKASACAARRRFSLKTATTSQVTCRRANSFKRSRICSWPSADCARSASVLEKRSSVLEKRRLALQQFELFRHAFPLLGIRRRLFFLADDGPFLGEFGVQLEEALLAVRDLFLGENGLHRALRLAQGAVDALVRIDHEKVRAFVKAVHRTDLHAIHVLALDAAFGDHECHDLPFY